SSLHLGPALHSPVSRLPLPFSPGAALLCPPAHGARLDADRSRLSSLPHGAPAGNCRHTGSAESGLGSFHGDPGKHLALAGGAGGGGNRPAGRTVWRPI